MNKTRIWRDTQKATIEGKEYILVIDNIMENDEEYFEYVSLNGEDLPKIDAAEQFPVILEGEWETVDSTRLFKYS